MKNRTRKITLGALLAALVGVVLMINRQLGGIETVLLYTLPEFSHISSSIVRELYRYGQDVSAMLPASAPLELLGNN